MKKKQAKTIELKDGMKVRTFHRVIPPWTADIYAETLDEARTKLKEYGECPNGTPENKAYWKEQQAGCKIVKVIEIIEEVQAPQQSTHSAILESQSNARAIREHYASHTEYHEGCDLCYEDRITQSMAKTFHFTLRYDERHLRSAKCDECGKRLMANALGAINERMIQHSNHHDLQRSIVIQVKPNDEYADQLAAYQGNVRNIIEGGRS